ncbi:MAG: isomerase [Isosphaeraceae bacterium]|jgi:sugar phosphate isomerase/epimerase|nr:MAG: isomerase [Isosphaeraceae bacterium]
MKLGLINSAWAQAGKETAFGIWKTRELGFDTIDVFVDPLDASEMELRLIRHECDQAGLPIVSVACVALGLVDFNPSVQRFHVGRVKAYLDAARMFGARNVLLVLGEYVWQQEVIRPEEQWAAGVRNVRILGEYAGELGLEIALEMEPFRLSLLNDVPKMVRFLDEVGHPSVRANVDISHMVLAGQPAEALDALAGRIAHVHISDCDGKVHGDLPPGRGVVAFDSYLRKLGQLGVGSDTISVELEYAPEPAKIVEWVREAQVATAALMRQSGLRP